MQRVFVLGAGASRFAGYPLGPDLWAFIRDWKPLEVFSKEAHDAVRAAMERVLELFPSKEPSKPNLEELFTLLDLAGGNTELGLSDVDWQDLRPKLILCIWDAFLQHEYDFQRKPPADPSASKVLEKWAAHVQGGDTLITLNWDLLHEAALFPRKWHWADGYGFPAPDAPAGISSPTKMLKLHGSVNWAQKDEQDGQPSIEYKADFFPDSQDSEDTYLKGGSQRSGGRPLIIPSYVKDISGNRLLLSLWNQASDALAAATEVVVIGYSLPPADALARHLLASALLRNPNSLEIVIVAPDPLAGFWKNLRDPWEEFCERIGRRRRRVAKKFEDWVLGL